MATDGGGGGLGGGGRPGGFRELEVGGSGFRLLGVLGLEGIWACSQKLSKGNGEHQRRRS